MYSRAEIIQYQAESKISHIILEHVRVGFRSWISLYRRYILFRDNLGESIEFWGGIVIIHRRVFMDVLYYEIFNNIGNIRLVSDLFSNGFFGGWSDDC